jgi:hypothetical protein
MIHESLYKVWPFQPRGSGALTLRHMSSHSRCDNHKLEKSSKLTCRYGPSSVSMHHQEWAFTGGAPHPLPHSHWLLPLCYEELRCCNFLEPQLFVLFFKIWLGFRIQTIFVPTGETKWGRQGSRPSHLHFGFLKMDPCWINLAFYLFIYLFIDETAVWTQGFVPARQVFTKQVLHHLSHMFSPFHSSYFQDGV